MQRQQFFNRSIKINNAQFKFDSKYAKNLDKMLNNHDTLNVK